MNLPVDDVIASFLAHARTAIPSQFDQPDTVQVGRYLLESMERASIFYMGDTHEAEEVMNDLGEDLYQDLADDLPVPFGDILLIGKNESFRLLQAESLQEELARLPEKERKEFEEKWSGIWWVTLISRTPLDLIPEAHRNQFAIDWKNRLYFFLEFMYAEKYRGWKPSLLRWIAFNGHPKIRKDGKQFPLEHADIFGAKSFPMMPTADGDNLRSTIYMTALISHPSNYIVKETPKLTPREERRLPKHGIPDPKRPRYIVVDHDVLVRMSEGRTQDEAEEEASRKSPVPHKRRGHWRRLADRCKHAKDRGTDRVFVRPSYIGKKEFEIGNKKYHVLLDFKPGTPTAAAMGGRA